MPLDGSNLDETTKVLIEGRRLIEESWFQGPGAPPQHGHCAVMAISRQNTISVLSVTALKRLSSAIFGTGDYARGIVPWNDAPERTKEDVLRVYDIAISASLSGSAYP